MYNGISYEGKPLMDIASSKAEENLNGMVNYNGVEFVLSSNAWRVGDKSSIIINGKECSTNKRGLNIVVIDARNMRMVDSVNIDYHTLNGVLRR